MNSLSSAAMSSPEPVRQFDAVHRWWKQYCHPRDGDAAARARLRRCRSRAEAMAEPAAIDLAVRMGVTPDQPWRLGAALDLARVLAHVKQDDLERSPMSAAGMAPRGSESPLLAEVRFRRLLRADSGEELVSAMTRLVRLLKGTVRIGDLVRAITAWNEQTRSQWALDYLRARYRAVPSSTDSGASNE